MRKLRLLAYALGLLALAYPSLVSPVLGMLGIAVVAAFTAVGAIVGWALAHLSLTLTIAAGLLMAQMCPGRLGHTARWLGGAWIASVAAVAPAKA
ncbi:hypothetical protein ACWD7T_35220 [Streptomyces sp. 900116325]